MASAQQVPVKSTNLSGTIASTGVFQSIQGVTNNRIGCTVQNNGSNVMYVYFGTCANATTAASAALLTGQSINCAISYDYVVKDQICITGTTADGYFANFQ